MAKRREFLRVYEAGRKLFSRYCVLFYAANDLPYSRIGITATKKSGKANVRNRLKRWTREVYRRQRGPLEHRRAARSTSSSTSSRTPLQATWGDYSLDLQRALKRVVTESSASR